MLGFSGKIPSTCVLILVSQFGEARPVRVVWISFIPAEDETRVRIADGPLKILLQNHL
jgi:hypothetical protein